MKAPSSFRQLLRNLHFAAEAPLARVLLYPGHKVHQRLWTAPSNEIIPLPHVDKIAPVLERIPTGGNYATSRTTWAAELTKEVFGPNSKIDDHLILPSRTPQPCAAHFGWLGLWSQPEANARLCAGFFHVAIAW